MVDVSPEVQKVEDAAKSAASRVKDFLKKVRDRAVAGWKALLLLALGTTDQPTRFARVFGKAAEWVLIAAIVFVFYSLVAWVNPRPAPERLELLPLPACSAQSYSGPAPTSKPVKAKKTVKKKTAVHIAASLPQLQLKVLAP